ncbi:MAG: thioredoxin family protein [Clostridia bacterium]|nr:thioredoxin family protein [Clostridia bacterium]MBQ6000809.1 thioredoxin family protein [Clostridia bacterium]
MLEKNKHDKENYYFYLPNCPYCKKAEEDIEDICRIMPEYRKAAESFVRIDESKQPDFVEEFDYYYVPTFYVKGYKICEGKLTKRQVLAALQEAAGRMG